jgi:putative heme-binding domain-containing protein
MRPTGFLIVLLACSALAQDKPSTATPAEELTVAPGFEVELLKSATKEEGSWVSMAVDAKGRLYISTQGKVEGAGMKKDDKWGGLFRATLDGKGQIEKWEKVNVPVGDAMGMLWAFDSLYVSGDGPEGRGIYRLKDSDGDDALDAWAMWKKVPGGNGEHGAHALVLGPDGKSIYIVHGNATPLIEGIDTTHSPYRNYAEDDLLPRVMDPVATFFDKVKSPYGYVLRTDENGTNFQLFAGGFRNPYDLDFNADGELFTYDSDMEWDVGMPWYRPTRVLHVVAGGEYGFREGTAKWPAYYPDSLPAAVNIGLGCPTGVKFGTRSNFPEKYRRAFFIMDWTFGRILAVHLHPNGASYTAKNELPSPYHLTGPAQSDDVEEFVRGKGLPVTDLEFGQDGAMYFTIGGRGTQAGLYRVSWTGEAPSAATITDVETKSTVLRSFATLLASLQIKGWNSPWAMPPTVLVHLDSEDRFIRHAARTALEGQPISEWRKFVFSETRPRAALTALLALARVGTKDDQEAILKALAKFPLDSLSDELKLDKLRVIEVALARHGRPSDATVQMGIEKLSRQYPAKTFALNRELCALLVWLTGPGQSPLGVFGSDNSATSERDAAQAKFKARIAAPSDVIDKSLALMDAATEPAEAIWYATCLREATGWTALQREHYFSWFAKMQTYVGGNSSRKFLARIRDQALEKVPAAERPAFLALAEKESAAPKPQQPMPMRPFVKVWTVADLVPALGGVGQGRDFARGQRVFTEAMCAQCHLFAGTGGQAKGGAVGPDLTAVGSRFSRKDVLEAIIEPSKAMSEQYASFIFTMKDGSMASGQIAEENHYLLTLIVDPISGARQNYPKGNVVKKEMSPVSLMPPGLLFTFSQEEVLDLLAYLESGGNAQAGNFKK